MSSIRAVKMGWNLRVNPAHHGFRSGWVKFFLQISIRIFDPAHLGWTRGESDWLTNPQIKGSHKCFFIKLGFIFGSC